MGQAFALFRGTSEELSMNFESMPPVDDTQRLLEALYAADDWCVGYVYRLDGNGRPTRPYALKCRPSTGLLTHVQHELGAGEYKLIIRRGRTMAFSGEFAVAAPRIRRW